MFNQDASNQLLDHYRDAEEQAPMNMPKPRGRPVQVTAFVDASHTQDKVNRHSHASYIIFINRAPILWYSKKQNTVESSAFQVNLLQ